MIRNSDINRLRGLFAKRLIATMDMLKKTVGTVADLTVFRKLRELDYCTSYSHRGRFYTLRELAEFDENGLWWIRSVGFSSRGTLVATAEGLVNASEAGYAVEELDAIVRVGTKDVLPKLAWEKRLRRTRIRNRNVYFSPKRSIREQQIASRRVWEAQPSVSKSIAAQDVLPDELKAAIILFFSLLDERERRVYAGLESLKLGYGGDRQMAEILGLDVSTVLAPLHRKGVGPFPFATTIFFKLRSTEKAKEVEVAKVREAEDKVAEAQLEKGLAFQEKGSLDLQG